MTKFYYGFEYRDGTNTTTGYPNDGFERWNGRLSDAGYGIAFTSRRNRDRWVTEGCNSRGGREKCTKARLNWHMRGSVSATRKECFQELQQEAIERNDD